MKTRYYQVITTCQSELEAKRIGRLLVEMRLAACAQVCGPVYSAYWWMGKIEEAREWICVVKCPVDNYAKIEDTIKQTHSYSVPEIMAVPVEASSQDYFRWLMAEASPVNAD